MKRPLLVPVLVFALLGGALGVGALWRFRHAHPPELLPARPRISGSASLGGRLVRASDSHPVPGAWIELWSGSEKLRAARSGFKGVFSFDHLPPGTLAVRARLHPTENPQELGTLEIQGGQSVEKEFRVNLGLCLTGKIAVPIGALPQEARIQVACLENSKLSERGICVLGEDGGFQFFLERAVGRVLVQAQAAPFAPSDEAPLTLEGGDIDGIVLMLKAAGIVDLRVVNEKSQPVPKAGILLLPGDGSKPIVPGSGGIMLLCDQEGRCVADSIPLGRYSAMVRARGYVSESFPLGLTISEHGQRVSAVIRVRTGWELRGKVLDVAGQAVADAQVLMKEAGEMFKSRSNKDGAFEILGIKPDAKEKNEQPGIDLLECFAEGYASLRLVNVDPKQFLTLTLVRSGGLEVSARLPEGESGKEFPWSLLVMMVASDQANDTSANRRWVAVPAKGPRAELKPLAPGVYDVRVTAAGRRTVEFKQVHVGAGETKKLEAVLEPGSRQGEPAIDQLELSSDDPAKFRAQVEAILKESAPQEAQEFLKLLKEMRDDFPAGSEGRKMWDEALKGLIKD